MRYFLPPSLDIPIISVGNLAVGGTGKTPHTEFILSILQDEWKTAVLSRGYKRKTKGFQLADENSDSLILGDETISDPSEIPQGNCFGGRKAGAWRPEIAITPCPIYNW